VYNGIMRATKITTHSANGSARAALDGGCEVCGAAWQLDQHHICPKGMGGSKHPSIEAPENKIWLCRPCHRNIHEGGWTITRTDSSLTVVDASTGELICRRLYKPGFDPPAFFAALNLLETQQEYILNHVPYLTDEQLVELFAYLRSIGRQAWLAQAAVLWEAKQRSVYGEHTVEAIARRFDIAYRTAAEYIQVYGTFFKDEEGLEESANVRTFQLDEPSWYLVAVHADDPHFWLGHAQDRKAQDPRYSIAEFRQDIHLGKESIEAGIETPIPPCPWQTAYCEKVLELITSVSRCRDCTVGQRLLGIAKEEQLTASNPIPRLEVHHGR